MKKIIAFVLCIMFCFTVFLPFRLSASADALTAPLIAAASYAIGSTFGVNFQATGWSGTQAGIMMETEVNNYVGQRSIAEVFGAETIRAVAGKMVVGQVAYNAIVGFLNNLCTKYNLGLNRVGVGFMFQDDFVELNGTVPLSAMGGWYLQITPGDRYWLTVWTNGTQTSPTQYNDIPVNSYDPSAPIYSLYGTSGVKAIVVYSDSAGRTYTRNHGALSFQTMWPDAADRPKQVTGQSTGDIGTAVVLNPGYGWAGDINGYDAPDTNLDQMVGGIFDDVADFNLSVDGEVIELEPPGPVPTPAPGIDEIIGGIDDANDNLTNIDTNITDLYEQGLEEIRAIGDARDAITDAVGDQTGALEGAIADNAGVVSGAIDQAVSDVGTAIGTQTGAISGAIDQAVSDVQTAIEEQTAALDESLTATAEGVESIAEAIEDEAINWRKFDLRGLFPFCIPFDIYNMLNALDASPEAPHVRLPFVIQSIGFSYMLDLDFSAFDSVAAILRQMELICYGLALAWATSKVIKW